MKLRKGGENNFSVRLKMARKMAGLSMDDLVKKMGGIISKQALSKYERGLMKPSSSVLIALSEALNVKPDHFYRQSDLSLSGFQFRKKKGLKKKEVEKIQQRTLEFLERYLELERLLGIEKEFKSLSKRKIVSSIEEAETAAIEIRKEWNLGSSPILNLLELLEEKYIKIFKVKGNKKFDGLKADLNGLPVIVLNEDRPIDRQRFTAAHELAHILFDFEESGKKETLCHYFAAAFLLPKDVMKREFFGKRSSVTFWELEEIKKNYGVSMQVILKRALTLRIISENFYKTMYREMVNNNWINKEPVSYDREDKSNRFLQLLIYSVSEGILSVSKAASLFNVSYSDFRRILNSN